MTKNEITKFGENNLSIFAGNDFFHQIADETNLDLSIFSIFDEMEISLKILRSLVQSGENEKAIEIGEKWLQIVEIENEKIKINKNTKNEDLTKKKKIVQILLDLKKIIEKAKNENEQKSAAKLIFETEAEKEKKFYEKIENGIDKKKTFSKKINLAEKLILIFIAEKNYELAKNLLTDLENSLNEIKDEMIKKGFGVLYKNFAKRIFEIRVDFKTKSAVVKMQNAKKIATKNSAAVKKITE